MGQVGAQKGSGVVNEEQEIRLVQMSSPFLRPIRRDPLRDKVTTRSRSQGVCYRMREESCYSVVQGVCALRQACNGEKESDSVMLEDSTTTCKKC